MDENSLLHQIEPWFCLATVVMFAVTSAHVVIRWLNRRDDPRVQKRPRDEP